MERQVDHLIVVHPTVDQPQADQPQADHPQAAHLQVVHPQAVHLQVDRLARKRRKKFNHQPREGIEFSVPFLVPIAGMNAAMQRVIFGKTGWTIDFDGCEDIVAGLPGIFKGWGIKTGTPQSLRTPKPRARISRQLEGWHWQEIGAPKARDWDAIPPRTAMRVITDIHDAAIYWYLDDNPQLLCLHGAAAKIGSSLVCFPARGRTGKSTLVANLAALGHRIFSDDVIGLEAKGNRGRALGFMPRLRLSLPPNTTAVVRKYIEDHQGLASDGWIYLKPESAQIAGLGETAKIRAIILLERADTRRPKLETVNTASILKPLVAENIIRKLPMPRIFDQLHDLASDSERYLMRYSDPFAAAKFLTKAFT
jgi:hypothetical protein